MGTEVQSKMHLPRYYSLRDLNGSTGKVNWPLHHENKNLEQYYNLFSTRSGIDFGYNKEQLRQTILKHESIFRHQLHELHRLYAIQRELMNELKSKELNRHLTHADTLRSTPFPSGFLSQNGELHESPYKNVQRRLFDFDLERPADEYISEGDGEPGASSVSGAKDYLSKRTFDFPPKRDGKLAINTGNRYSCNGDGANSSLHLWGSRGYTNLNKPTQVQEIPRQHLSSGSKPGFQCSATEFSRNNFLKGREGGSSLENRHVEIDRSQKGWFSSSLENGSARSASFFSGSFHPQELNKQTKPVQVESTKAQPSKAEISTNRKFFGVEISERSNDISATASVAVDGSVASASHSLDQIAMRLRSDKTYSEIFSVSTWDKFPSSWSQNAQGNPSNCTLSQLNGRPVIPTRDERVAFNQNGFYFGSSSESGDSRVLWPSVGFNNQNGTTISHFASERFAQGASRNNCKGSGVVEAKTLVDLNTAALPLYQNEPVARLINNVVEKQENLHGESSWLKATKDPEVSYQIEMKGSYRSVIHDSLSATSVTNTDHRRKEADHHLSSKKILGFPIFEVESKDMPSPSSTLKSTCSASAKGTDPLPPESGGHSLNADFKQPIDLNLSADEEEVVEDAQPPSSSPKASVRFSAVIDLEAPAAIDMETESASGFDSESQQFTTDSVLAEALVALSSTGISNHLDNGSLQQSETLVADSLNWLADIISSYRSDSESDSEDSNGLDYFEFMTLNLTETTEQEECHFPPVVENNEKPITRRPRRGQARRGRQRRDFQRDILPNLSSLSRNEVTHDLQKIEGLIQATGGNWISSLTQKNNARISSGRGRKRSGGSVSVPVPPSSNAADLNPAEAVTTERSLTGWGKRTRRPPRQRCPIAINNPPLPVK